MGLGKRNENILMPMRNGNAERVLVRDKKWILDSWHVRLGGPRHPAEKRAFDNDRRSKKARCRKYGISLAARTGNWKL